MISQILFDYNSGEWELMISGPGDKRTFNLIEIFLDQVLNQGTNQIIVAVIHTTEDSGYLLAVTNDHHYCERWFMSETYGMTMAFTDIVIWCRQEANYYTAKRKEERNGEGE